MLVRNSFKLWIRKAFLTFGLISCFAKYLKFHLMNFTWREIKII